MTASAQSADLHRKTAQQVCDQAVLNRRMFFQGLRVKHEGCEELFKAVRDGAVSMNLEISLLTFDDGGQRLILAEFPSIKPRERAEFIKIVRTIRLQEMANG